MRSDDVRPGLLLRVTTVAAPRSARCSSCSRPRSSSGAPTGGSCWQGFRCSSRVSRRCLGRVPAPAGLPPAAATALMLAARSRAAGWSPGPARPAGRSRCTWVSPRVLSRPRSPSSPSASGVSRSRHGPWRDYVTLTKPRIMSLLLLTGAAGMFVGAQGVPPLGELVVAMTGLALACGGASALNHVMDARHRPPDGQAHELTASSGRPRAGPACARVRARTVGPLVRAARVARERR